MPQRVCFDGLQVLVLQKPAHGWVPSQPRPCPTLLSFGTQEAAKLRQNFPGPEEGSSPSPVVINWDGQAPMKLCRVLVLCTATFTCEGNPAVRGMSTGRKHQHTLLH